MQKRIEEKEPEPQGGRKGLRVCSKARTGGFGTECWYQKAQELGPGGKNPKTFKKMPRLKRSEHDQ